MARRRKTYHPVNPVSQNPQPAQDNSAPIVYRYANLADMAKVARGKCAYAGNEKIHLRARDGNSTMNGSWFGLLGADAGLGTKSGQQRSFDIALNGWPDGAAKVGKNLQALLSGTRIMLPSVRRRPVWTDEGDELNRDRMYSGQFDQMYRRAKRAQVQAPPVIRIAVNPAASWDTEAESLFWRGAAPVALCDALIKAGYSVEVIGAVDAALADSTRTRVFCSYVVKHARAPYSFEHVAAGIAFPGAFRGIVLAHHCVRAEHQLSQGTSGRYGGQDETLLREGMPSNGKLFYADQGISNLASAQAWVNAALTELGGSASKAA